MVSEAGSILVLVNLNGAGVLRGPTDSNSALPEMSRFKIVLAALETLRHARFEMYCVLFLGLGSEPVLGRFR